jgi:hypothetical protein
MWCYPQFKLSCFKVLEIYLNHFHMLPTFYQLTWIIFNAHYTHINYNEDDSLELV